MKIGILTQALLYNYGCLLQNYALQTILKRNGHEVETLDWDPLSRNNAFQRLNVLIRNYFLYSIGRIKRTILQQQKENAKQGIRLVEFINKYISRTQPLKSAKAFSYYHIQHPKEAYIVGSDQTWRPAYNPLLEQMFLQFTKNDTVKRIAYATSFGVDFWEYDEKQTTVCSKLAKKFDLITVRESSGISLCKEYLGVEATHVLDPTMLLQREDYIRLVENEHEVKSEGNLFYYVFNKTPEVLSVINGIAQREDLTPFTVNQEDNEGNDSFNTKKPFSSVTKWLRGFMDAKLVIIDSFHGMVFSIIFNKDFWVIGNPGRGMARFESLLSVLQLEHRLIPISQLSDIQIDDKIDWENTNILLEKERQRCIELLNNYLR